MFANTFPFLRRVVGKETATARPTAAQQPVENPAAERRLWIRHGAAVPPGVQVGTNGQESYSLALVQDISQGGVSLFVDQEFSTGQILSLELPLGDSGETHIVLACVVRVVPSGPGQWTVGCVFSRDLSKHDLEVLGGRKVRNNPSDKRAWLRCSTNRNARFQKIGEAEVSTCPARVVNLSAAGAGLVVPCQLESGALLNLELLDTDDQLIRTILACVVYVAGRDDGTWSVGCNFIRELSGDELKALV